MLYGHNVSVHTTYGKIVYILYGEKKFIQHIDKLSIFRMNDYITIVHLFKQNEQIILYYFYKVNICLK